MPSNSPQPVLGRRRVHRRNVLLAMGWYAGPIHQGVARYARDVGWILNSNMMRSGGFPEAWRGEGIVCILGSNASLDEKILSAGAPIVNIGPAHCPVIPTILPDNDAIGRLAAEHFVGRGFKQFAYYLCSGGRGEQLRLDAFRRHLTGREVHLLDWASSSARQREGAGEERRLKWLRQRLWQLPKPLAVFAEFDDRAVDVIQACQLGEIPVPEQVAVLGVDNDPLRCDFAPVPLSSIDDNQDEQGFQAAAMLDRLMSGEKSPPLTLIRPRGLVTRQSTEIMAVEHPDVASALRCIWEHYTEPITAESVAEGVPMSPRRLHDAFVRHVGRSMAAELARRRIEHAQRLLAETRSKLPEVARLSGFSSADRMGKVFLRMAGTTPSAYRKRFAQPSASH